MDVLVPAEIVAKSPSVCDGVAAGTEETYRIFACDLVQEAGILLRLPQAVMITAQAIVHRFFYRESLTRYDAHQVAMAAVFLAAKVEENARRAQDIVNVFVRVKQARQAPESTFQPLDQSNPAFDVWKAALFLTEAVILKELGYDMYGMTCHPHRFVLLFGELVGCPPSMLQRCWNYVNDAFRLPMVVIHPPESIACVAVLCAAEDDGFPLPQSPPWHALLCPHTDVGTLTKLARELRGLYGIDKPAWLPSLRRTARENNESL